MADAESNPVILEAYLVVGATSHPLPYSFLSIAPGNTIVSRPQLISQIGLHKLMLKISDGGGLYSIDYMTLNVSNTPPYFT